MTVIEDLGDFLASNGLGTVATDIFFNKITASPDSQIAIFTSGSYPQRLRIKDVYPSFTIQVRNEDSLVALTKINSIYNLFDNEVDGVPTRSIITPSGRKIIFRKIMLPIFLKYDDGQLAYYSMGFDTITSKD